MEKEMSQNNLFEFVKKPNGFRIVFSSTFDNIDRVAQEVKKMMCDADLDEYSFATRVVLREALTNAVRHGNAGDSTKRVTFDLAIDAAGVCMTIEDEGPGFDWKKARGGTSKQSGLLEHGRGIDIITTYYDNCVYNARGNTVRLEKKFID